MSTFLDLCNLLHQKTGEGGVDFVTTKGHSGYRRRVVRLVAEAWEEIQGYSPDWRFLRKTANLPLLKGTSTLDVNAWATTNLSTTVEEFYIDTFSIYKTSIGISDETRMTFVPLAAWKSLYGITYADGVPGRPRDVTQGTSEGSLILGPSADKDYMMNVEFQGTPVYLVEPDDTPNIQTSMQKTIVHKALFNYGVEEESNVIQKTASKKFSRGFAQLRAKYYPPITIGGPLA